jgi:transketolase
MSSSILLAYQIRKKVIELSFKAKTSHLASSLSCVDIVSVIFQNFLKKKKNGNKFILSKGHAATTLYSVLFFFKTITKKEIESFAKSGSKLEEHPTPSIKGVEAATGSLGHGLCIAVGIALGLKLQGKKSKVFAVLSDGECNEGSVWEAILFSSAQNLNNLVVFIDYNKWQATGKSNEILALKPLKKKFQSFSCNTIEINGHDHKQIYNAIKIKSNNKPIVIIANTIKGKGVSFMEDDNNWHYKYPSKEEFNLAMKELKKKYEKRIC